MSTATISHEARLIAASEAAKQDWSLQNRLGNLLCYLSRGKIDVDFDPTIFFAGDEFLEDVPSRGHVYEAHADIDCRWGTYWLDDRGESLEIQLAKQLRKHAKKLSKLADHIEAQAAEMGYAGKILPGKIELVVKGGAA